MQDSNFLDLLKNEPVKKHPVNYYADKLCITPKYLTAVCKRESKKSASEWIGEYILEDVRYYLRNTNKTIKEIITLLNFPTTSAFGTYVRKHLGVSPNQYRKKAK